jgi:acetyl esterase/lipase
VPARHAAHNGADRRRGIIRWKGDTVADPDFPPLWPAGSLGAGTYDAGDHPAITPCLVPSDRLHGAVIVCPGGGYARRAPHEGEPVARWLNSLGISAFVLSYRVAPYRHPHPLADAQRAIRYVRAHAGRWHIDPARVGILGFSAGGHLAATAATHFDGGNPAAADPVERAGSRPDAVILCYPVISFVQHAHQGSARNLLGDDPSEEQRRLLSNELHVTAETPPAFLWHTAEDGGVPVENSLVFGAALRRHGVPFALHVFPHGRHGLGLAQDTPLVSTWPDLCAAWLRSLSFGITGGNQPTT